MWFAQTEAARPEGAHERDPLNASVAEVDHHELWQRTAIAVAATGAERYHLRKVMQQVERFVEAWGQVEVIDTSLTLHYPEE